VFLQVFDDGRITDPKVFFRLISLLYCSHARSLALSTAKEQCLS
jgi:hypothetical protein